MQHITAILDNNPSIQKINVCGHSLGGALATIAAVDLSLWSASKYNICCFTIGCPRVGNKAFKRLFNYQVKHVHRLVNQNDPIQWASCFKLY
eukprot:762478-Hanusia_phi.AAC.19